MAVLLIVVILIVAQLIFFYQRASMAVNAIGMLVLLAVLTALTPTHPAMWFIIWCLFIVIFAGLGITPLRYRLLSQKAFDRLSQQAFALSPTERAVLQAGQVGFEAEFFTGQPDWSRVSTLTLSQLSAREQAFLDTEVAQLCSLINDWQISRNMQIPEEIWKFIRAHGFFGLIIPQSYGGLEFSATAHGQIITKIASHSMAVAVIISVPNSLGPAELLLRYGTATQKDYYLPRLAQGLEIPCFALTSPVAGSDAGAIVDKGIVCHCEIEGVTQLGIRLQWNKRYITLAPQATLLGLAFKLYDPDHLLGETVELGITCALIPTHTPGVIIGRRHYPLDSAFPNGPTQGKGVIVPLTAIIGGQDRAGQGWKMLMECLAAGRGISLPSMAAGGNKKAILATSTYVLLRQQFNRSIADFDGIKTVLARMTGLGLMTEALRLFATTELDLNIQSPIAAAITKYHVTEWGRKIILDAMDIHGGKGICMGPGNYLAQAYIESPIAITVEGANILTRNLIIFGQGVFRCHPYLLKEIQVLENENKPAALIEFDKLFLKHIGFFLSQLLHAVGFGLKRRQLRATGDYGKQYYRWLTQASSVFALITDILLVTLGSRLKTQERLSARMADLFSGLYIATAVLKYFQVDNKAVNLTQEELTALQWIMHYILFEFEQQLDELIANLPAAGWRFILRMLLFPFGRRAHKPDDRLDKQLAELMLKPGAIRERIKIMTDFTVNPHHPLHDDDEVFRRFQTVSPLLKKLKQEIHPIQLEHEHLADSLQAARAKELISEEEMMQLLEFAALVQQRIAVDDFKPEFFTTIVATGEKVGV